MASALTDEERGRQYDIMREEKKRCEKVYNICGWVIIGLAVFIVLPSIYSAFLHAMFRFEVRPIGETALIIAMFLFGLFGIARRSYYLTGISLVLMVFVDGCVRQITGIPEILPHFTFAFSIVSIIVGYIHWRWGKLKDQEGFPDFNISYQERAQHEAAMQKQRENHLLAEGAERRQPNSGEMTELLDEEQTALPAELSAYKDRFTQHTEKAGERQYTKGEMDEL